MDTELTNFLASRNQDKIMKVAMQPLLNDSEIKRVEIIVLKYKSPEMEQKCAENIIKYTDWPYKLNFFDNRGNGPNTSKAWNKLIRESTCDYILFIDSDAFVQNTITCVNSLGKSHVCWLTEMMKPFVMWDNVAIVGPTCGTDAVTTMQSMAPQDTDAFEITGHISGYCFLIKKSIFEKIGEFDEDFCFYGQESDWIERVLEESKYKIVIAPRAHVLHGEDGEGSLAAKQAEREGELSMGDEATYSYLLWNFKKKQRMQAKGKAYDFKY